MSLSKQFKNVIIWGYPYGTHTHSFVWYGFYKAFSALGIETHWFSNGWSFAPVTSGINVHNTLFICERNDMVGMPISPDSTYLLHMMGNRPETDKSGPLRGRVKRLVDWRQYCENHWDDSIYTYSMKDQHAELVDPGCLFEHSTNGVDNLYCAWATDMLPDEIKFDDCRLPRTNESWYIGTVGGGQGGLDDCLPTLEIHDNRKVLFEFREACKENNVNFMTNCPWKNPLDQLTSKRLIQNSYLAPDARHPAMVDWGYIPCRVMKNISYGQLGLVNSPAVEKFLEGEVICRENGSDLFYEGLKHQKNYAMIERQMKLIKEKHTYINRARSIIKALEQ